MADRGWNTEFVPTQGQRGYGQQLARTPKSGWGGAGIFAPFFNPGCTAESPTVFLPVLPVRKFACLPMALASSDGRASKERAWTCACCFLVGWPPSCTREELDDT